MVSAVAIALVCSPSVLYFLLLVLWHALRRYLLKKENVILDLQDVRISTGRQSRVRGTAVVCGGRYPLFCVPVCTAHSQPPLASIAGLLTARVCHDFFENVIIVEPEAWLATPDGSLQTIQTGRTRSRVMQYSSLHATMPLYLYCLDALVPGSDQEFIRSGINLEGYTAKLTASGVPLMSSAEWFANKLPRTAYGTRDALETITRRLILGNGMFPRITQVTGTIIGIASESQNKGRIRKVVVRTDQGEQEIEAELVADCTGVSRAGYRWLERAGYGYGDSYSARNLPLDQLRLAFDQKLHYVTFLVTLTPEEMQALPVPGGIDSMDIIYTHLESHPADIPQLFLLTKPEPGNRILLFVGQAGDEPMPETIEKAEALVRIVSEKLEQPVPEYVFEVIDRLKHHEATTTMSRVRVPGTAYMRYHLGTNMPTNFVAVGDSVMSEHRQGCTKAMLGAIALHNILRRRDSWAGDGLSAGFAKRFFAEQFNKTDHMWQSTRLLASDYGSPVTIPLPGESLSSGSFFRKYFWHIQRLGITDLQAAAVMTYALTGIGTSIEVLHPRLLVKVLWRMATGQTKYYYGLH
ncbi:hypothetical protein FISHEDRAFT_60376 [Fistulina hepatica ATCC 64428]|uniref:FAD/NAD(P)-binding domain-containing protein n=1 Tax=Fistulina hepatica ATCC 64428 TaxID=1128425 RepID=A0A0D7A6R2_9AGAR|nr:hypothetical protein FISHEDRAFT_60376 [Fistulina hepatica ATCC 64428]